MNQQTLSGVKEWQDFERQYQLEQRVYDLTLKALLQLKESLGEQKICAFAFCADAYYGDLTLSYHIYDGELDGDDLKQRDYYPPDWSNEVDDNLEAIVENDFRQIIGDSLYQRQEQQQDEAVLSDFAEGYLNSLRNVMARLEKDGIFSTVNTTDNLWLVVTEIDADAQEEDRKLNEVRSLMVKSI
jgi:hypothetical protein